MRAQEKPVITIAGAGNVGTFLAVKLYTAGCRIKQVYSRNLRHASLLADKVNSTPIDDINFIQPDTDLIIIALPDKVIPQFCKELSSLHNNQITGKVSRTQAGHHDLINESDSISESLGFAIASVSGSVQLSEISGYFKRSGVLYPLQSFTLKSNPDTGTIPFCIEGNDEEMEILLSDVASIISNDVRHVDSVQRLKLHLSAVFASNFTNHMIALAEDIITKAGLDFNILRPLINETINRLENHSAADMQTGPAIRNDKETIDKHLEILKNLYPDNLIHDLYKLMSESIICQTTKKTSRN